MGGSQILLGYTWHVQSNLFWPLSVKPAYNKPANMAWVFLYNVCEKPILWRNGAKPYLLKYTMERRWPGSNSNVGKWKNWIPFYRRSHEANASGKLSLPQNTVFFVCCFTHSISIYIHPLGRLGSPCCSECSCLFSDPRGSVDELGNRTSSISPIAPWCWLVSLCG